MVIIDTHQRKSDMITTIVESDSDNRVVDIHIWRVGTHHLSAIISIVTRFPRQPDYYKKLLSGYGDICHMTIEVNRSESYQAVNKISQADTA